MHVESVFKTLLAASALWMALSCGSHCIGFTKPTQDSEPTDSTSQNKNNSLQEKATAAEDKLIQPVPVNYEKLAFYPRKWRQAGADFEMLAWNGKNVSLVTKKGTYDRKQMTKFVNLLDGGWQYYEEIVGAAPKQFRHVDGRGTICAMPAGNLSCGLGCGYLGMTGIEVAAFYRTDFPNFTERDSSFSHYYFYEMGRNYFIFKDRHSIFTTGYAVFMRYVCMDKLQLKDRDRRTRKTIEECEAIYADSKLDFISTFTNFSQNEKGNRLANSKGRAIVPSDQPVMYATAMLKLRKSYGGDAWVKKFYHAMRQCEPYRATDRESALPQCYNWLVCASLAAEKDLTSIFSDRWRLPMSKKQKEIMSKTDWTDSKLSVSKTVKQLILSK